MYGLCSPGFVPLAIKESMEKLYLEAERIMNLECNRPLRQHQWLVTFQGKRIGYYTFNSQGHLIYYRD